MDDKIIETSTKLFLDRGIKAVSMDDVAQALGISKRTLYEHFSSKDELLIKCMEWCGEKGRRDHAAITTEGKDVLQICLEHLFLTIMQLKQVSIAFLQDISRIGKPGASSKFHEEQECNKKNLVAMIEKGQADGFIRDNINIDLMLGIFTEQSETIKQVYATGKYSMEEIFVNVFVSYLRGMCTIKGINRIDELVTYHYKKNEPLTHSK